MSDMLTTIREAIAGIEEMQKPPIVHVVHALADADAYITMEQGKRRGLFISPALAERAGVADGQEVEQADLLARLEDA